MSDEWDFPENRGFHAGSKDTAVLEDLEELKELTGWSTSECLKRATRMYLPIEEVLREHGVDFGEQSKRHFVKQAIRNEIVRIEVED